VPGNACTNACREATRRFWLHRCCTCIHAVFTRKVIANVCAWLMTCEHSSWYYNGNLFARQRLSGGNPLLLHVVSMSGAHSAGDHFYFERFHFIL